MKNTTIIIDNGSGTIKVGFSNVKRPTSTIPTIVGHKRNEAEIFYCGDEVQSTTDDLRIRHPIQCGYVYDWDAMVKIWDYIFRQILKAKPDEQPVLLTEPYAFPRSSNREKMTQIMFETFNVPAMYVSVQAVLALYASGRTTGLIVESGEGITQTVPIYEGYSIHGAMYGVRATGNDLTRYLKELLRNRGYSSISYNDKRIVRDIKEKLCYVAIDYEDEMSSFDSNTSSDISYTLPDGKLITIGSERFQCPEALFRPSLCTIESGGIHENAYRAIGKCAQDIRDDLYANIVIAGGNTMYPGIAERLHKEIAALAPKTSNIKIIAPQDRKLSTFLGGSVLASTPEFKRMWMSREEYEEIGPSLVNRKCF